MPDKKLQPQKYGLAAQNKGGVYPMSDPIHWWANLTPEQRAMLDQLRDHYKSAPNPMFAGKSARKTVTESGLPYVPHPSSFQPDPLVMGPPGFARMIHRLVDLDPGTKERIGSVVRGPTLASMRDMTDSGLPIGTYEGSNLLGVMDKAEFPRKIGLQHKSPESEFLTGAHEIAHAAGHGEQGAYQTRDMLESFNPKVKALVDERKKYETKPPGSGIIGFLLNKMGS